MYFLIGRQRVQENRALCPRTAAVLDAIPRIHGMAMFSALLPNGQIASHCGPSNTKLTIHLGLVVPPGCGMRVSREARSWEEGKCLVFDDSFEHESWNRSSSTRFILFLDIWHPDLSDVEIDLLSEIQDIFTEEDHVQDLHRIRAAREQERGHAWWPTGR